MDTLFSHVSIVTMDDRMSVWTDSFLGVTDGKISYLGKKAPEEQPQTIIDGSGMVLMPGPDQLPHPSADDDSARLRGRPQIAGVAE